ncbi:carboxypeptidase-like regulatory domain-containing protein [Paludisphaera borealis]|uniref:carboxypeptidase-like regulatory domain-containing protein n=1 Tax=Paludisphaera borealis TaxID=1387353 RepID=UPI001F1BAB47|nr:carboxypeptidase-like regulatory domain-containing protein [Paludisphaera borealis]
MDFARRDKLLPGEIINDALAERTTDADGRFEFTEVLASGIPRVLYTGETVYPCDVVALASGRGLAWLPLKPHHLTVPITLTLGEEGIIRGKLVEPGGNPVAGASILITALGALDQPDGDERDTENRMDLRWSGFLGVKTGADGRFIVRGLSREMAVTLIVAEPQHERLVVYAATEPPPSQATAQQNPSREAGKLADPELLRGDFTLTIRVADHVLNGRVVFEADDKPAPNAQLNYVMKSATRVFGAAKLDAEGKFRIEGLVPGTVVLRALNPQADAVPADVEVSIPETPKESEYTLVLPRGLVVRGRVVDGASGQGVGNVDVRYIPEPQHGRKGSPFGLDCRTDFNGRYRMVVPAGRGAAEVFGVPREFDHPLRGDVGDPPNPSYSRQAEGEAGQTIELADIPLNRLREAVIRVVSPDGRPVRNAEVSLLDSAYTSGGTDKGRTDAEGRYRTRGLQSGQSATVDVVGPDGLQGGTAEITRIDAPGKKTGEIEVRLSPLGSLSGRVLGDDGVPLPEARMTLFRNVRYAEQSDPSFGKAVDVGCQVAGDGSYSFKRLIPGGVFSIRVEVDGHATATSADVKVKPGEDARFEDFRLPFSDQEITGVVVDPRGKPLAGVTATYERDHRGPVLYAPNGAVWFQNTDASGRFHLTGLPRGAKRIMAYRNEGTERNIRNLKRADVAEGQKDIRIELPDVNERLRGIE